MSTIPRRVFSLQLDTATPKPSAALSKAFATPTAPSNACSASNGCAAGGACSNRTCTKGSQAVPFAPAGSLSGEPTTQLNTGIAIGIGAGVVAFTFLMVGIGFWFFRMRSRRQPITSPEALPTTRDRSASTATKWTVDNDQRTLVASMPNSPQHTMFTAPQPGLPPGFYTMQGKAIDYEGKAQEEKEIAEYRQQDAALQCYKAPANPVDKALPLPPTQEMRYAINVNINKSMIFDDITFNTAAYAASPISTPQERALRYRFEEYVPPVPPSNPRISIMKSRNRASRTMSSEYELENYQHGSGYVESSKNSRSDTDSKYSGSQSPEPRDNALSKLEHGLSLPELQPPSPSLSFLSYDWYQDIIGGDQPAVEPPTPELPTRNPARALHPLSSHPPDVEFSIIPEPVSPAFPSPVASSYLHPSSARLSRLTSPTCPDFRLSPTVYQMPSGSHASKSVPSLPSTRPVSQASTIPRCSRSYTDRYSRYASWVPEDGLDIPEDDLVPPRFPRYISMVASIVQGSEATQTARTSARYSARTSVGNSRNQSTPRPQSTTTQRGHYSRSGLPRDVFYLAEEGTEDYFEILKHKTLASRPTSYSPLA